MKIYALVGEELGGGHTIFLRFYRHKEDAKWALNRMLADQDDYYCYEEYENYAIEELEVEE